jgi:FAD/FMN-containing dehydrogenase
MTMETMQVQPPRPSTLTQTVVEAFKATLKGEVLAAGDVGYDAARTVWNAMIDRRPALIARCVDAEDVIHAVNFARTHDLLVAVRGGGHNVAGKAVCDGGLMIDLSPMKGIDIDPEQRTARVEPGVLWSELDQAAQAHGLATTGGTVSHTGVAGLTLGGGLGWLMAAHGLACDNLLSAEVVLAEGRRLTASSTVNPDLFWAIRGGGGNFGIVSSFEFRLHPVGPTVLGGMVIYPMTEAREVLRFYRDITTDCPDELTVFAGLLTTPEGLQIVALIMGWFGAIAQGEQALAPLRNFGAPLADLVGPIPYCQLQSMLDASVPFGWPRYWKSGYFTELSDEVIDLIIAHATAKPSPLSAVPIFHIHGAAARVNPESTAFALRRTQWDLDIVAQWTDPATADANIAWARDFWEAVAPFSTGVYVNHLDSDDGAARVRAAYGANYARLVELKRTYDPDNFFRLNHNIVPNSR